MRVIHMEFDTCHRCPYLQHDYHGMKQNKDTWVCMYGGARHNPGDGKVIKMVENLAMEIDPPVWCPLPEMQET